MNKQLTIMMNFIALIFLSCTSQNVNEPIQKFCGYEMTINEVNEITEWSKNNPDVYDVKNGDEIYSEINDSLRNNMPDDLEFEIFLTKLTKNEVCIDVYITRNEKYFEDVSCTLINTHFSKLVPEQRKIRIYSYTNPDGSGDSPFEVAIKSKI
jgi:hypothetical protein